MDENMQTMRKSLLEPPAIVRRFQPRPAPTARPPAPGRPELPPVLAHGCSRGRRRFAALPGPAAPSPRRGPPAAPPWARPPPWAAPPGSGGITSARPAPRPRGREAWPPPAPRVRIPLRALGPRGAKIYCT